METPLDVLSRAASFVHANEEESKFYQASISACIYEPAEIEFRCMLLFCFLSLSIDCCTVERCRKMICIITVVLHIDEVQLYLQSKPPGHVFFHKTIGVFVLYNCAF